MSESRTVVTAESLFNSLAAEPAKVEEPTETAHEVEESEPVAEESLAKEKETKPKSKKPLIEELVRTRHERNELREQNKAVYAELESLRNELNSLRVNTPQEVDAKPNRMQFVSDDDYAQALADWHVDKRLSERQQQEHVERTQVAQQRLVDSWNARLEASLPEMPDFSEVVGKTTIDIPNHLYTAILESETGPQIAYYLAKNPDEARRLVNMSHTESIKMLGRLEDRLGDLSFESKPAKPEVTSRSPEVSKAPKPIDPIRGENAAGKPTDKMTYAEYKNFRAQQLASKQR
jgi:hypothetical protein